MLSGYVVWRAHEFLFGIDFCCDDWMCGLLPDRIPVRGSLRSPAPPPSTLLPARALRLLVLPCPLRSCLACLGVSIQLLNRPRRGRRLLCSGRSVGCALASPLLGLSSLCQRSILGMGSRLWTRIRPAPVVILLPTAA